MPELTEDAMRVLFVGNSHVYFNDLPGLVASLAASSGAALETHSCVEGGMTLLGHARRAETLEQIRAGGWDAIVLQEQSTRPIDAPALMELAARQLAQEVERAGSRVILYLTWARRSRGDQQTALDESYYRLARELGATVAPVGPAWQLALARRPGLALHQVDGSHPAASGTYLAACVFLATLTGRSPVGLDARTVQAGDGVASTAVELPRGDAELLQRVAWEKVQFGPVPGPPVGGRVTAPPGARPDDLEVALAQETALLRGLSGPEARSLLANLARREVPAGTTLFSAGDLGSAAYLVLGGAVDFAFASGERGRYDLTRLGVAAFMGEETLRGEPYGATVTAASEVTLLEVGESDLAAVAARDPAVAEIITRNLRPDQPA